MVRSPRVGFEPTTNRLTVDCSTTELSRIIHMVRELMIIVNFLIVFR
jgi:hypothetical protein